jgi:hypothetical protein
VRIVRRQARRPRSPLGRIVRGAAYRVEDRGWISGSDSSNGGIVGIHFKKRQRVDAIVPAWAQPWSRRSFNYRYSRRFGYTPYRRHLVSRRGLTDMLIDVDMRVRRIIEITPEYKSEVDVYEPLPGHCPIRPDPPGWN